MRKTLKILSIALAATLLVALCAVLFAANTKVDAAQNTGDFAVKPDGGRDWNNFVFNGQNYPIDKTVTGCAGTITVDGTVYYLIATKGQLNGTFLKDAEAQNILIACDIPDFAPTSSVNNTAGDVIDGLGHTITFVNATASWFNNFGGNLKNVTFAGQINLSGHGAVIAPWFKGGKIENVVNNVDLLCNFSGQSNGASFGAYTAGFVGAVQGNTTISYCEYNGDISIVDADTVNTHARLAGFAAQVNNGFKLTITNCVNTGNITHPRAAGNAIAGLVAITDTNSTLIMTGCSNSGAITSNYMAGGLVGQAKSTVTIDDCVNTGNITGIKTNTSGIIAQAAKLTISDCVNGSADNAALGTINGASNTGAIVGYAGGALDMDNCNNYASVTSSSAAGGLVGKLHDNSTIDNSHNFGAITGTGSNNIKDANGVGGLVGGARQTKTFKITGCTNNGDVTSVNTAYAGGILGTYARSNPTIVIDKCVNNGDVILAAASQSYGAAGGITAGPAAYNLYSNDTVMEPKVTIKNTVNNGDIISKATTFEEGTTNPSDLAGFIARTGMANLHKIDDTVGEITSKMTVLLENCVNTGDMIDSYTGGSSAAGLIARIQVSEETSSVTIKNCVSTGAFDLAKGNGNALAKDLVADGSKVTVTNFFYINGVDADFAESTEQVSEVAMASGYVAYKLGWGQKIGTDAAPVYGSTDAVYEVALKATAEGDELAKTYSNVNAAKIITLAKAGVEKRAGDVGFRVLTAINAYDYEVLAKAGVEFKLGTLITANKYGVSTYEELKAAGKPCLVVNAINGEWYDANATDYTFAGSLLNINDANLGMEYAVRGYIEIDGAVIYTDAQVVVYNNLAA